VQKFKVELTRLVEENCYLFVNATDEADAIEKAMDMAPEVAQDVWLRKPTEPHQYDVGDVVNAKDITKHSEE
jgi:hypothetical protein